MIIIVTGQARTQEGKTIKIFLFPQNHFLHHFLINQPVRVKRCAGCDETYDTKASLSDTCYQEI